MWCDRDGVVAVDPADFHHKECMRCLATVPFGKARMTAAVRQEMRAADLATSRHAMTKAEQWGWVTADYDCDLAYEAEHAGWLAFLIVHHDKLQVPELPAAFGEARSYLALFDEGNISTMALDTVRTLRMVSMLDDVAPIVQAALRYYAAHRYNPHTPAQAALASAVHEFIRTKAMA